MLCHRTSPFPRRSTRFPVSRITATVPFELAALTFVDQTSLPASLVSTRLPSAAMASCEDAASETGTALFATHTGVHCVTAFLYQIPT
uniref:Uncharacterized protein n=1 Tax=Arundo donax TaxID=35708 RepID=A0A0A8ZMV0_ARUDO